MILRDCMLYAGIRSSRRFAQLSWFQRDFFYGLLHAAWPAGRFEADVGLLRAALYGPLLSRVSQRDVQEALAECHRVGLVKLETGEDGRGWGEVVNYRQHGLKKRKQQPDAEPDGQPLDPPGLLAGMLPIQIEGKKEGRGSARRARKSPPAPVFESQEQIIERLRTEHPGINIDEQLKLAVANRRKAGKLPLDLAWFEHSWLKNCGPTYEPGGSKPVAEPDGWRGWFRCRYPDTPVVQDGRIELIPFSELPADMQAEAMAALRRAS